MALVFTSLVAQPYGQAQEPRLSEENHRPIGKLSKMEQTLADEIEHQKSPIDTLKGKILRIREDLLLPGGAPAVVFKKTSFMEFGVEMKCGLKASHIEENDRIVPKGSLYRIRTVMEPTKYGDSLLYRFDFDEVDEQGKVKPIPGLLTLLLCKGTNLKGNGEPNVLAYHILGSLDERVFLKMTDEKDPLAAAKAAGPFDSTPPSTPSPRLRPLFH